MADLGSEEPPMMRNTKRPPRVLTFLIGILVLGWGSSPARAQWGLGFGWGWGGFGFNNVPSPTDFLNQHALTRAARGMSAPSSHSPYANNPNAYFNRIRDNGFVSHYDVRRRRPPSYQTGPTASLGQAGRVEPRPAEATTAAETIPPLGSFFNASQ